jgi:hypothetical protein
MISSPLVDFHQIAGGKCLRECLCCFDHVTVDPRCQAEESCRTSSRLVIIRFGQLERPSCMVRSDATVTVGLCKRGAEDRGGRSYLP